MVTGQSKHKFQSKILETKPRSQYFDSKVFGTTSKCLKLLIGFLVYLEPKLWLKNKKLDKY